LTRLDLQDAFIQLQHEIRKTLYSSPTTWRKRSDSATAPRSCARGRILQIGTPHELRTTHADPYVAALVAHATVRAVVKRTHPPKRCMVFACTLLCIAVAAATPAGGARIASSSARRTSPRTALLGEIFARLLEARTTLEVDRKLGLAGTQVCFEALRRGDLDVYPEYTAPAS
jgi:hypothetical protein